ncbi:MAG: YmdB family metallophosphoesterase [Alphaproteobacteria bacterium]|nr:YmdB family metallophosphoesterase [Alphaproteobacteria bacterium]
MKIVYLGDIVARVGREAVIKAIPLLKEQYAYHALIVNADNAANGFGTAPQICNQLFNAGVSAIVSGDHVWNQKDLIPFLNDNKRIVRPLNYADNLAGVGAREISLDTGQKILVTEIVGRVFMDEVENPLLALDVLLEKYSLKKNIDAIFVDIHAEATAEKQALAHYFDGRVSAIIGSHTHVPTSDACILPKGTAYQTDAGMCGDYTGVIGFLSQTPIERLKNPQSNFRLEPCSGTATVCGTFIETDDKTGLATTIKAISLRP